MLLHIRVLMVQREVKVPQDGKETRSVNAAAANSCIYMWLSWRAALLLTGPTSIMLIIIKCLMYTYTRYSLHLKNYVLIIMAII